MSVTPEPGLGARLLAVRAEFDDVYRFGFAKLLSATGGRARLVHYLTETWHYVRFSVPLLERAAARMDDGLPDLRAWFLRHVAEERGHDDWLLDDLERLGVSRVTVRASLPSRETATLVGTQLWVLEALHPAALLGYVWSLECRPPGTSGLEELAATFDAPPEALSTLRAHGTTDPGHLAEILQVADGIPPGPVADRILWNARIASTQAADVVLGAAVRNIDIIPF